MVESRQTTDTKSEYGERRTGIRERIVAVVAAIFAVAFPVLTFGCFLFMRGWWSQNHSRTLPEIFGLGQTGRIFVGLLLLSMAVPLWREARGMLAAAWEKAPPLIHVLAEKGDEAGVAAQLAAEADANSRDQYGNTPLHIAAFKGHSSLVSALLAAGADVNSFDNKGVTALHKAAHNNHREIVSALLTAGANKDAKDETGGTPLHHAASASSLEAMAALLDAGANKDDLTTSTSLTPLHLAAVAGAEKPIALLLAAGANSGIRSSQGKTALDFAAAKGHAAAVRVLGVPTQQERFERLGRILATSPVSAATNDGLANRRVKTLDGAFIIYQECDLNSPTISPTTGTVIQLGVLLTAAGHEWVEATLPNGDKGYALGPNVRGHSA